MAKTSNCKPLMPSTKPNISSGKGRSNCTPTKGK